MANTMGPIKMPISPKAINPPMTPTKTSSSGRFAPFLIRIGRRTLSRLLVMTDHPSITMAQSVSSLQ